MRNSRRSDSQLARTESAGTPEPGFWLTTFLFSIPFGFVVTLAGTAVTLVASLAQSGEAVTSGDYGGALLSSIVIGLLIFVGFCYLIVPIAVVLLAMMRLACRFAAARGLTRRSAE